MWLVCLRGVHNVSSIEQAPIMQIICFDIRRRDLAIFKCFSCLRALFAPRVARQGLERGRGWRPAASVRATRGGGGGTPYVMGDTYVPRFWPPFFTLAGSSTIFLGCFFSSTNTKTIFWVQILAKFDLFGPKIPFFPRSFWVQFSVARGTPPAIFGPSTPPPGHVGCFPTVGGVTIRRILIGLPATTRSKQFRCMNEGSKQRGRRVRVGTGVTKTTHHVCAIWRAVKMTN